jgi:hypothetical protein
MKDLSLPKQAIFNYPPEFVTHPEYTARAGKEVTVVRELIDGDEYDKEEQTMYLVSLDGWEGHACESELEFK